MLSLRGGGLRAKKQRSRNRRRRDSGRFHPQNRRRQLYARQVVLLERCHFRIRPSAFGSDEQIYFGRRSIQKVSKIRRIGRGRQEERKPIERFFQQLRELRQLVDLHHTRTS